MTSPMQPEGRCPKCGAAYGFIPGWLPTYEPAKQSAPDYHEERLRWDCQSCGYEVYTPTADKAGKA